MLIHQSFFHSAEKYPHFTAIIEESGLNISYKSLKNLASHFTECINNLPIDTTNSPGIGILSTVHHQSVAAVLGILNSGHAYIPLDEKSPQKRIQSIIKSTDINIVIADSDLIEQHSYLIDCDQIETLVLIGKEKKPSFISNNRKIINFFDFSKNTKKNSCEMEMGKPFRKKDDLAYILHTSGSTGTPKGIMLSHRNAQTFIDWMQEKFNLTTEDKVISRAPLKFDLSVFDIFNTLSAGATLVCFDWNKSRSSTQKHKDYVALLEREKATILYTTPSTLTTLKERGELGQNPNQLRSIMYAGEPFPIPKLQALRSQLPSTDFFNIYGPTETNIITYFHINQCDDQLNQWKSIPLGEPAEHTDILVVNEEEHRLCEPDETGEFWCCSNTVCQGYLNQPMLTQTCISIDPFESAQGRYWKTGDFGFRDMQGLLHYRGRKDHLVKIKGYRVEIGEIESALATIDDIHEYCVVVNNKQQENEKSLHCYYSTKNRAPKPDIDIISALSALLPFYMIPERFMHLDDLPKTPSGKIDRVYLSKKKQR